MKLVIGLGNPGRKYEGTRHNVGFDVVEELVRRHGTGPAKIAFLGLMDDVTVDGERLLLLRPQTFMNRSGTSAVQARHFYKLTNEQLLVVCDDFNLPVGKLRIRAKGSAGGQKGLDDIIRACGSDEVPRLRIGIGSPPERQPATDFVLSRFGSADRREMKHVVVAAADAVTSWARDGIAACMNRYNASGDAP